ncbi:MULTISPECIES: hypothetical protein [Stappiaceae]|jgi:hypothetical protein|uniref:hypothetical protein n=1 Tax=Stappiaceae TaxID=2821832 RepID=UPI000AF3BEEA|nr:MULTISPECIES: hypothetical protein [Stappiaceae]MEC9421823.1 hypothetical protein [Pseudomonadota bacterium]MBO6856924.1 hypothetical protein [Roseibium sp.]MBO9460594.1 hypothetical protein [Labrenzia sp. R5_0]NKI59504.1 hypothetical protein [Labrenzia sp. PO1]NKX63815.1 hypothetical protein [Labrenzia sp. 5N]
MKTSKEKTHWLHLETPALKKPSLASMFPNGRRFQFFAIGWKKAQLYEAVTVCFTSLKAPGI